jgi:hypothetical protein
MLKATEIKMVTATNLEMFQENINKLLKDNWTLHGEIKAVSHNGGMTYIQPMVKLEMFEPGGSLGLGGMPPLLLPRG